MPSIPVSSPYTSEGAPQIEFFTQTAGHWHKSDYLYPWQPVRLQVRNLPVGKHVELRSQWQGCRAHASFTVDSTGTVDLAEQAPIAGNYTKADPDGLFWSMKCLDQIPLRGADQVRFTAWIDKKQVASAVLLRQPSAPGIQEIDVHENGLVGKLVLPPGKGPFPTILELGGSEGGLPDPGAAAHFAQNGYAVLRLAYFKEKGLPRDLDRIKLGYFGAAIEYLQKRPEIDSKKLAVFGTSRGGELALNLGARYPQLDAVIASAPSGVSWGASSSTDSTGTAWLWEKKPVPTMRGSLDDKKKYGRLIPVPGGGQAIVTNDSYLALLKDKDQVARDAIPVEKTQGPVLLLAPESDQIWPSAELSKVAWDRLRSANRPYRDERYVLHNAGHILHFPDYPSTFPYFYMPEEKHFMSFGGTAEGNGVAQRRAQQLIDSFLDRAIGPNK